ncbi:MAG: phosphatase [Deltaproteobacteria bacterium]|nr:phosphatase [Deltaproteobacteria bacterium]
MPHYPLNWVTEQLAVGHAPMSYDELQSIREQGVDGIVNLCGEYTDLHQIEKSYGFEVYYLPVDDDQAPALRELEKALDWLDESLYLGKKVLVHCTHGIGRTGTFVSSYLLRRGFSLKLAKQKLKKTRAEFTSFYQWWFLRKFGKKEKQLTVREPSLEGSHLVDLEPHFAEYESLVSDLETSIDATRRDLPRCGQDTDSCCTRFFPLELVEATYSNHHLNKKLTSGDRLSAIDRAVEVDRVVHQNSPSQGEGPLVKSHVEIADYRCPLSVEKKCILYAHRPVLCRVHGLEDPALLERANQKILEISRRLFFELNGAFLEGTLLFPVTHVVSGRFIQDYFNFLMQAEDRQG